MNAGSTLRCGLLGEKLSHSYSPQIHNRLGDYSYELFEVAPSDIEGFLASDSWDGLNVTIPYKETVFPYLDYVSDDAKEAGCVNTIIKHGGKLYGDNTDIYGFKSMVIFSGIDVVGKVALVLGSGGASKAVCIALRQLGCDPIVISRSGDDNYENISRHSDAEIIVNTTPVGMYPANGSSPIDLAIFPNCKGVLDVVYNPSKTALILQAEKLGIPCLSGLYMLVAQAAKSSADFVSGGFASEEVIEASACKIDAIYKELDSGMKNIALIGMPGCGKSTIARELSKITDREVLDTDDIFADEQDMLAGKFIEKFGEARFREAEHEIVKRVGALSGKIISTGGGVVTYPSNYDELRQNSTIIWLKRNIDELETEGRPLSKNGSLQELFEKREPMYKAFADYEVEINDVDDVERIIHLLNIRMD